MSVVQRQIFIPSRSPAPREVPAPVLLGMLRFGAQVSDSPLSALLPETWLQLFVFIAPRAIPGGFSPSQFVLSPSPSRSCHLAAGAELKVGEQGIFSSKQECSWHCSGLNGCWCCTCMGRGYFGVVLPDFTHFCRARNSKSHIHNSNVLMFYYLKENPYPCICAVPLLELG